MAAPADKNIKDLNGEWVVVRYLPSPLPSPHLNGHS